MKKISFLPLSLYPSNSIKRNADIQNINMQNYGEHVLNKQEGIVFKSINQILVNLTLEFGGLQMSDTTD